jgi:hypothetical protein
VVRNYLDAIEDRDLDKAAGYLANGFVMVFPGNITFRTLEELAHWAKRRYRFVTKKYERFDEAPAGDGTVVYCFGTLSGEWPDGKGFSGIRFIDRFTVAGGKLIDQKVWNDLVESRNV